MEPELTQPEYAYPTSAETTIAEVDRVQPATSAVLPPPAAKSDEQWRRIGAQTSRFLTQLPDDIRKFFSNYKQPLTSVVLVLAATIAVKVVLAVLDALNDLPLLVPTLKLIGIGYSVWFVNRYLLKASKRQELSQEIQTLKEQVVGSQQPPAS